MTQETPLPLALNKRLPSPLPISKMNGPPPPIMAPPSTSSLPDSTSFPPGTTGRPKCSLDHLRPLLTLLVSPHTSSASTALCPQLKSPKLSMASRSRTFSVTSVSFLLHVPCLSPDAEISAARSSRHRQQVAQQQAVGTAIGFHLSRSGELGCPCLCNSCTLLSLLPRRISTFCWANVKLRTSHNLAFIFLLVS